MRFLTFASPENTRFSSKGVGDMSGGRVEELIAALASSECSERVRDALLCEASTSALQRALHSPDSSGAVVAGCASVLGRREGCEKAQLWPLLQHSEPSVRHAVLEAAVERKETPPLLCEQWHALLFDSSLYVQRVARAALSAHSSTHTVVQVVAPLLQTRPVASGHAERAFVELLASLLERFDEQLGLADALVEQCVLPVNATERLTALAALRDAWANAPQRLSSAKAETWIRQCLERRDMQTAAAILGHMAVAGPCGKQLIPSLLPVIVDESFAQCRSVHTKPAQRTALQLQLVQLFKCCGPSPVCIDVCCQLLGSGVAPKVLRSVCSLLADWGCVVDVSVVAQLLQNSKSDEQCLRSALMLRSDWDEVRLLCELKCLLASDSDVLRMLVWDCAKRHIASSGSHHGPFVDACLHVVVSSRLGVVAVHHVWEGLIASVGPRHEAVKGLVEQFLSPSSDPQHWACVLNVVASWSGSAEFDVSEAAVRCFAVSDDWTFPLAAVKWFARNASRFKSELEQACHHWAKPVRRAACDALGIACEMDVDDDDGGVGKSDADVLLSAARVFECCE